MRNWTVGNVSGSTTLTGDDAINEVHVDELREAFDNLPFTVIDVSGNGDYDNVKDAIDAAPSEGGRILVKNSSTVYTIDEKVSVPSNITIEGESYGGVTVKAEAGLDNRMFVNTKRDIGSGFDYNILFKNLIFDMNGENQGGSSAPTFSRTDRLQFVNCKFINPYDSLMLITGNPDITLNTNVLLRDVDFIGTGQVGTYDVVDLGSATNMVLDHVYSYDSHAGGYTMMSIAVVEGLYVIDSKFDGAGHGSTFRATGCNGVIANSYITNSAEAGIRLDPWDEISPFRKIAGLSIENVEIGNSLFQGIWVRSSSQTDQTYAIDGLKIAKCHIHDNVRDGIRVEFGRKTKITDCDIFANDKNASGTYAAINAGVFGGGVEEISLRGNDIYDKQDTPTQTIGIKLTNTTNARLLANNVLNTSTPISRSGDSGTKALFNLNISDI